MIQSSGNVSMGAGMFSWHALQAITNGYRPEVGA